jgi:hypothetical protein
MEIQRVGLGRTQRVDVWWRGPVFTAAGLFVLFGYLTFRAFNATYVWHEPYVSPAVAPPVFTPAAGYPGAVPVSHAWFGAFPEWWPSFVPQTPALVLPWLAIVFRFTCYYYRGAIYRSFTLSPPSCAVRGLPMPYRGETRLLIVQNLHRYALYGGLFLLICLWWEAMAAFFRGDRFGIGVGTVVMLVNAALLSSWTLGCHSWRHLIGGRLDCFSCTGAASPRYRAWRFTTWLNERHATCAWASLVWVVLTDLYIYLVARGIVRDVNTWG